MFAFVNAPLISFGVGATLNLVAESDQFWISNPVEDYL
jgi:hypothetical protein